MRFPGYTPNRASILYHHGWATGRFYTFPGTNSATPQIVTEKRLYFSPLYIPRNAVADRIGVNITTGAGDVECQMRCGIYLGKGGGLPGTLLLDAGATTVGTGTGDKLTTISQGIPPGAHWLAVVFHRNGGATGTMPTLRSWTAGTASAMAALQGYGSLDITSPVPTVYDLQTIATWSAYTLPSTAPVLTYDGAVHTPVIGVRAA